jgi:tetratricopeptide (TPR) repeat protein
VIAFLASLALHVYQKSEAELEKKKLAAPERHVLNTLSDRAFAAEDMMMSVAEVPEAEQHLIQRARELLRTGEHQAALDCLTAERVANNWFASRLFYVGYALHHTNRNKEAFDVLSRFIELQGESNVYNIYRRNTRYYRARALVALARPAEAVSDLTTAIEIASAAELHELRARAHEMLGNADAALLDRRRAAELSPIPQR